MKQLQLLEAIKYTYDGWDVIREESSLKGVTVYQNGLGIDDKLRSKKGNVVRYFLTDHLGSTVALADVSGAIVSSTTYDSFGNATSNIATTYRYTGREYDSEISLYYYRNRWYDPETGRFISEDPIGFAGGDINLYGYVGNNPLSSIDPLGEVACDNGRGKKPSPKERSACKIFVDQLVGMVVSYSENLGLGHLILKWANAKNTPTAKTYDVRGFRNELVRYGQGGEVYRHLLGHIGGTVLGSHLVAFGLPVRGVWFETGQEMSDRELAIDRQQAALSGTGDDRGLEAQTEVLDDLAGREVGRMINKHLLLPWKDKESSAHNREQLRRNIFDLLCEY